MQTINKIAVIGAGMMGAEIALCFALCGAEIRLNDINPALALAGKKRIEKILARWADKGKMDAQKCTKVLKRITPQDNYDNFAPVELVVEAALEDVAIKLKVFTELEEACGPECILATNTSSIPITELAGQLSHPGRFIGLHFFSPATIMKLVEVIPGLDTTPETVSTCIAVIDEIGKKPVRVADRAGFLVNRLLFAFFNEAWRMVEENVATPEDVDKAVKLGLGHPLGLFQMQDLVGLDNALAVSNVLCEEFGERFKPSALLKRKVAAGHHGRKTKRGWFDYGK